MQKNLIPIAVIVPVLIFTSFLSEKIDLINAKEVDTTQVAQKIDPSNVSQYSWQKHKLGQFLNGSPKTIKALYMGNSRIARVTGFAYDGLEDLAFENNRLAGNGFVVPLEGVGQNNGDVRFLFNSGGSMTDTPQDWKANDPFTLLHSVGDRDALILTPGRTLKMANFGNDVTLMPKSEELKLTVQYMTGPDKGTFKVTPVEVSGNMNIIAEATSTIINTFADDYKMEFTDITLPAMQDSNLNRSFTLEGVDGDSLIFRVNVLRNVENGISVSEMAVGGKNYNEQSFETDPASWTTYVRAYDPDVVIWEYAGNHEPDVELLINKTKELMDRVDSVNPAALHILTIDHPTPRTDWQTPVTRSTAWSQALEGYHGAIVVDPTPYLPQDFLDLAGTENLGIYFDNPVHENRFGAYTVFEATWEALKNY